MEGASRDPWFDRWPGRSARCLAALLLSVIGVPGAAAGESGGTIGGRVIDADRRTPLAAIRVTLQAQAGDPPSVERASFSLSGSRAESPMDTARATLTDDSGLYRFDHVPPGLYLLTFAGESRARRAVSGILVDADSDLRVDSDLDALPSERITVTGRPDAWDPGLSRTVLGRDDLAGPPAGLGDPFRALSGRAGISPESDFKSEVRVRGGDANETAILLDGQPLPYAYHFGGSPGSAGTLNGDLVDSVEVATGGFSVEYGDAIAGVVDLSTRRARPERTTGTAGIGSLQAHAALFGPAGDGTWLFSGRFSDLGLYDDRVSGNGAEQVAFHDLFGAIRMPIAAGARLEVSLLQAGNDYRAGLGYSGHAAMSSASQGLRARLEVPFDPGTLLRVQAADSDLSVDSEVTGGAGFDQGQRRRDLGVSLLRVLKATHRLNGGLGAERILGGMRGSVSDGYGLRSSDVDYRSDRIYAFVEDTWRPAGIVTLRYGARADRSSWTGETVLSPRFSLEVEPLHPLKLRCAFGRFVQFPRQEQIFLAAGEPLRQQVADHLIAGFEYSLKGETRLIVEGYRKDLRDPIGEATNRYVELPELLTQFDRARVLGAEIVLEHRPAGAWSWQLDYAYLEATQARGGIISPRNTDQRHSLGLSLSGRLDHGWRAGAAYRYSTGLPYTPVTPWTDGVDYGEVLGELNAARLPAYGRLDLRLERKVAASWGRLDFRLDLLNVLNRHNVRSIDLAFEASEAVFYETTYYQSPFLPAFSVAAEF